MQPIPVNRLLVPDVKPAAPDDFLSVTTAIQGGLPHLIPLDDGTRLILTLPTGLALTWRDSDPSAIVSRSDEQIAPAVDQPLEPIGDVFRAAARLLVQAAETTVAAVPLVCGVRSMAPDSGDRGARIELVILSWVLHAGSIRGAGDFGSRLSFAWKRADQAIEAFSTPPPNPVLIKRLEPARRVESHTRIRINVVRQVKFAKRSKGIILK